MKALKICPLCGSKRMQRVETDLVFRIRGRAVQVPQVPRDKCLSCGEVYLDPDAGQRIDAKVFGKKRLAA